MNLYLDAEEWLVEGEEKLLNWLENEARLEKLEIGVDIVLVTDEVISRLNEDYLNHTGATDVISFNFKDTVEDDFEISMESLEEMPDDFVMDFPSGEIYVSLETAEKQASEYGVSITDEVSRLAVHGLMHLAGWEDGSSKERKAMSKREDEGLLRALGEESKIPWAIIKTGKVEVEN